MPDMKDEIAPLGRFPGIPASQLSEEQRDTLKKLMGLRDGVPAPYRAWLASPGVVLNMASLGNYLRRTSLTPRELEIAVLVTAYFAACPFVQAAHRRIGERIGLKVAIADAIAADETPALNDPRERMVYEVSYALCSPTSMPPDLARAADTALGAPMAAELIGLIGLYSAVCHTMKFYEVPAPE